LPASAPATAFSVTLTVLPLPAFLSAKAAVVRKISESPRMRSSLSAALAVVLPS
jgi:hypothetical protein